MSWFLIVVICVNDTAWSCSATTIPKGFKSSEECVARGNEMKKLNQIWIFRCVGVPD